MSAPAGTDDRTELVRLTQLLYQLPIGILRCDIDGRIELMNGIVANLFAHLLHGAAVHDVFELLGSCFPDLRALVREADGCPGALCLQRRVHVPPPSPDHPATWLSLTAIQLDARQFVVTLTDITGEIEHQAALHRVGQRIASLAQPREDVLVCTLDADGTLAGWSSTASRLTGWTLPEVLGRSASLLFDGAAGTPKALGSRMQRALERGQDVETGWLLGRDRSRRWCESRLTPLQSAADTLRFVLEVRDLSRAPAVLDELDRQPKLDYLTGALNRAALFERAQPLLDRLRSADERLGVVVIAADGIAAINAAAGPQAGDDALRRMVRKVQGRLGPGDLLARVGSDRFCALLPGRDADGAQHFAERIRTELREASHTRRVPMPTASFGVAHDDGDASFAHLLARAEQAARHAKAAGRDCVSVSSAA